MKRLLILLATLSLAPTLLAQAPKCPPPVGHIAVESGTYSTQPGVSFRLHHFAATLVPQGDTAPFCYGKTTVVSHADIFVDNASLTKVFSDKLNQSDSKIKNFKVTNGLNTVTLSGSMVKIIPLEFSIAGEVTTDGDAILMHASKIKADGIPVKLLLEIVGQHLSSVLGMKGVSGVTVQGDTLSFFPEKIAHLKGTLKSVESTPEGLTLHYGHATHRKALPAPADAKAGVSNSPSTPAAKAP